MQGDFSNLSQLLSHPPNPKQLPQQSFNPGSIGPPTSSTKPITKKTLISKDIWDDLELDLQVDIDPRQSPGM
jgi:hypothetical protein